MKKIKFLGIAALLIMMFFALCTTNLYAAGVGFVGDEDENDSHVVLYSQEERSYHIEVNEETNYGYVIMSTNHGNVILGSCVVIVNKYNETNGYNLCELDSNYDNMGILEIMITSEISGSGFVNYVSGSLEEITMVGDEIILNE